MGFKTDTSFLRFLSMGAMGVTRTMDFLRAEGFAPIELERYCASNKIWMTKVKRLRLPDVLCVKTGLRLEVRAKSDLKIRMSDAPQNPDRTWDAGLRDDDLAAFIAITEDEQGAQRPADAPVFFSVKALRETVEQSKLGPPKSASEGAERDRTWPATIPSRSGAVISVSADRIVVEMRGDGAPRRTQSYRLEQKNAYVKAGDRFQAGEVFLAGAPASLADLASYRARRYEPLDHLAASAAVDRYAAVKALPHRADLGSKAVAALEGLLHRESDERVGLEAAGAAATLGSNLGRDRIGTVLWKEGRADLRMEAVLILTELKSDFARAELRKLASDPRFQDDEIRQAAVWGLGKAGLQAFEELIPFIADTDENVALHAIVGFDQRTPAAVIETLIALLRDGDTRKAAAASEALRMIGSEAVVRALIQAVDGNDWVMATLGRLPAALVNPLLSGSPLLARLAPIQLLSEGANWLASESRLLDIAFLTKQNL